jgi:hypothetical protein
MAESLSTKHLDILQAAIARMAGYCFIAKGWSVTLTVAVLGFAAEEGGLRFLWIGALAVLLFWLIDAYYLALERGFRDLFQAAVLRLQQGAPETFDLAPAAGLRKTVRAAVSASVLMVHPPLLAAFGLATFILG